MKVVKNLISIIMSILIIAGLFTIVPFTAGAETFTSGEYDYELLDDNTAKITRYFGDGGKVEIPSELDGHTVTAISGNEKEYDDEIGVVGAFQERDFLTSVTIPDSVESIGDYAFALCEKLENVTFGKNLKKIGEGAFFGCDALNEITFSDSLTSIDDSAFEYCESLTSVTIPESVTSIGVSAFSSCKNLAEINVPDSVTSIGGGAFGGTAFSKNKLNFEDDVLYIGKHLIAVHPYISGAYKIKDGTISIAPGAFSGCNGLKSITIPDSITKIEARTFSYCKQLESVTIGKGVNSIGNEAFFGCFLLSSVKLPKGLKELGDNAFNECKSLKTITITAETIGSFAFHNCYDLKNVNFNGTKTIGKYAFANCTSLKVAYIPKTVEEIKYRAFTYCYKYLGVDEDSDEYAKRYIKNFIFIYDKESIESKIRMSISRIRISGDVYIKKDSTIKKFIGDGDYTPFVFRGYKDKEFIKKYKAKIKNYKCLTPKSAGIKKNGDMYFLKNDTYKFTVEFCGYKLTRVLKPKRKTLFEPSFDRKKITVKKGNLSSTVDIKQCLSFIKPKILSYNKKVAKISFYRLTYKNKKLIRYDKLEIKGLKKGKTTLKVRVNGVKTLKLKIKVK